MLLAVVVTGQHLAIPSPLGVRHSNISLRDVIAGCRDLYVSKYLSHYTQKHITVTAGGG